ncbi:hypothetical protein QQF64_000465 [Cirrhinus molitorella]|uniref:Uncharacterized protein n=1 Tax=Cirrhinus molitorella TaxID=172907 RepID=A0ABR3NXT1_9TELE
MGSHLVRSYISERDTTPDPRKPSAYDPNLGFPERKEREMVATQEQMNLAMLPPANMRDTTGTTANIRIM